VRLFFRFDILCRFNQVRQRRTSKIFMVHVIHDAQKINRLVAFVSILNVTDTAGDAIDGFVGDLFRSETAAGRQNRDQPPADLFVNHTRLFTVGIEPVQQPIEIFLPEIFKVLRG
jgi:hypothetical protein